MMSAPESVAGGVVEVEEEQAPQTLWGQAELAKNTLFLKQLMAYRVRLSSVFIRSSKYVYQTDCHHLSRSLYPKTT